MAKVRSPVLGFNHNIRHKGWLFHVQTEDSGVQSPHIYTHLFHDGVILATKKMVYDPASDVEVVKALMQAQHKAVLKELKQGVYDDKIAAYLGDAPGEASGSDSISPAEASGPAPQPPVFDDTTVRTEAPAAEGAPADVSAAFRALSGPVEIEAGPAEPPEPPADASMLPPPPSAAGTMWVQARPGVTERPFAKSGPFPALSVPAAVDPEPPAPTSGRGHLPEVPEPPAPPPRPKSRTQPPTGFAPQATAPPAPSPPPPASANRAPLQTNTPVQRPAAPARAPVTPPPASAPPGTRPPARPRADDVIVARPAVIIGGPPQVVGGAPPAVPPRRPTVARESVPPASIFGQDLISEKSLDEVIMAYLSEDAENE